MGSRGRSIRLRIYFLVAIPLIAMVGLLGYVVTTTVDSAVSLDRAPNLVNATAVPAAKFGTFVAAERTAAVVYLFQPSPANLQAYQAAIAATDKAKPAFTAAMTSEATTKTETADAAKIVHGIVTGMNQLPKLRDAVKARAITPIDAFGFYSSGFGEQVKLFLTQTESVVTNDQQSQAIGLIATVQAREQLAQEDALLAGMLAGQQDDAEGPRRVHEHGRHQAGRHGLRELHPDPGVPGQVQRGAGRVRHHAAGSGRHRAGHRRGHSGRQAARQPGPVAAPGRHAAAGRVQRGRRRSRTPSWTPTTGSAIRPGPRSRSPAPSA